MQSHLTTALSGFLEKKTDSEVSHLPPGSHNLTEKVVPWCKLIYDRSKEGWRH